MGEYRITFIGKGKSFHKDIIADSLDAATNIGAKYAVDSGLRYKGYTDISVGEIPRGASIIGIEFEYDDAVFKRTFREYMLIRADSEKQAHDYYNEHFRGRHFKGQGDIGKVGDSGKCVYGRVCETYFAACTGYHIDIAKGA